MSDKIENSDEVSQTHFEVGDKGRFCVATIEAMNFQNDILSIPIDNFKDHYVLVFDMTSIQDAT